MCLVVDLATHCWSQPLTDRTPLYNLNTVQPQPHCTVHVYTDLQKVEKETRSASAESEDFALYFLGRRHQSCWWRSPRTPGGQPSITSSSGHIQYLITDSIFWLYLDFFDVDLTRPPALMKDRWPSVELKGTSSSKSHFIPQNTLSHVLALH